MTGIVDEDLIIVERGWGFKTREIIISEHEPVEIRRYC